MAVTLSPAENDSVHRRRSGPLLSLSLIAVLIVVFRVIRTVAENGPLAASEIASIVLASMAVALVVGGAVVAPRGPPWAAILFGGALGVELFLLGALAPPRFIAAIPLFFAFALVMVPPRSVGSTASGAGSTARSIATIIALGLMVPIGVAYLSTGLVASEEDLWGAYGLFAVLLTITVWMASRRTWWVVAMPFVSAGLWMLMLWFGERFLDWSA